MKKLFYVLPVLGLVLFTSCDKDESDEVLDENLIEIDRSEIEITEVTDTKNFDIAIPPGLYGSINVDALNNVTYTYHPTQSQLNTIPSGSRGYRIHFEVDNPLVGGTNWQHRASFDIPSNSVTVKFPLDYYVSTTRWRIRYEMYNKKSSTSFYRTKIVNVHYNVPG